LVKDKLSIEGMSCDHCVSHVTKALESIEGMRKVKVNLKNNVAEVVYDGNKVSLEAMKRAVSEAGYRVVG
jgi:copper ion binding protein